MTTPPVDGEPPADMKDTMPDSASGAEDESDDSKDTDDMGIDDDDPIDATLVGGPVDDSHSADDGADSDNA